MNRRNFLRNAAILTAGVVAADQLDLVERLGWTRRVFPGWSRPTLYGDGNHDDASALQALFDGREVWDAGQQRVIGGGRPFILARRHFTVIQPVSLVGRTIPDGSVIMGCVFEGGVCDAPLLVWQA